MPLRYQRIEVDAAEPAAGSPVAGAASTPDPDTGAYDRAMTMATGDAVDLGRVNLAATDSAAVRSCMLGRRIIPPGTVSGGDSTTDAPVRISLRQDSATGPALVEHYPLSDDATTATRIASPGFGPTCWRLTSIPFSERPLEAAPRLFLVVDFALPGTLEVSSIDLNGTPADPRTARWVAPDPSGMRTLFDGRSFRGWTQTGCVLRDGAATTLRTGGGTPPAGCSMKSAVVGTNRIIRLEVRRESFYDNAAIGVPSEVQMRSVGEYLPGGYFQEYAARWQKLYAFPFWSTLEIVQLGARYVVRINGRTVTDHLASKGAPARWQLSLATQPQFSYVEEAGVGFGSEFAPRVSDPGDWGGFWFRNVRSYQCTSLYDPVCVRYATINEGQAPRV